MELRQIFKVIVRWAWLIVIPVVVVLGYVALTYVPPGITYQVVLRFAAGTAPAGLSLDYDRYYPWLTSEYIANGLADVAETGAFAEAVAERLAAEGLEIPAESIKGAIVTDNAQSIIVVYLTWADREQILPLADAITEELETGGGRYYPQLANLGSAARRLDEPLPVPLGPSLRAQLLGPGLKIVLAGGVGFGLAFLAHYLDPMIRERQEVDLPLLAAIPRHRRKRR
jgi:capsular polysaccharide biosynthesis protein